MRRLRTGLVTGICVLGVLLPLSPAFAARPGSGLPDRARAQIEALAAAKAARNPTETKLEGPLLAATQLGQARPLPAGAPRALPGVDVGADGRTRVEVRGAVTARLSQQVQQLGGTVLTSRPSADTASVELPVAAVTALAALPEVHGVRSLDHAYTTGRVGAGGAQPGKQERAREVRARVQRALEARQGATASATPAPVVSEGDRTHGADRARAKRRLTGLGVTVGVLSDGVSDLAVSVAAGELPADVDVLAEGAGNEGTAMLEVVHDVAPGARLAFATGLETPDDFAAHIRALRRAGADVIVDDLVYTSESPFQDGPVARAVAEVTAAGVLYVSSAGNQGNIDDGTAATYEGTFRPSVGRIGKFAGAAHDFDPGTGVQLVNPTAGTGAGRPAMLYWAEPLGSARTDYDLYALDAAGDVVAASNSVQDGDDDPFEQLELPDLGGEPVRLAVVKFSGTDRYLHLSLVGDRFASSGGLLARTSPGASRGHANVPAAIEVGAAPAAGPLASGSTAGDLTNPAGPYPALFTAAQQSERFTSDGPRRMFFSAGGTALTPGRFGSEGGRVRNAPDVTAADGVRTSVLGFDPFFGTSAAAPHVAGMAALALSGRPALTPTALRTAMGRTAVDIERRGRDRNTGDGLVMAEPLLTAVGARAQPYVTAGTALVTSSTDGDAFLEPGERGLVSVPVTNAGGAAAAAVSVRLRSSAAAVGISPASRDYGTVAAGGTRRHSFTVTVPRSWPVGKPVTLRSRVGFKGSFSPLTSSTRLVLGQPASAPKTYRYTGPSRGIPDGTGESVSVGLRVAGAGRVSRVSFSLDGTRCETTEGSRTVGLAHTFAGDLVGTLTSPDGTRVRVLDRVGGNGHNFCRTVLEDAAGRPLASAPPSAAPFTGRWKPSEPLAAFAGRSGDGTWTFTVEDSEPLDEGTLHRFSLRLEGYVGAAR